MIGYIKNHKLTFGLAGFLLVITIAAIITLFTNNTPPPTAPTPTPMPDNQQSQIENTRYGSVVVIDNWTDYVENLPDDQRSQVESELFLTLSYNFPAGVPSDIKPEIRARSYQQTYDPDTQIFYTEFLVDISAIEQTYRAVNQYSQLPWQESGLTDYTSLIYCPTAAELIWPAFDCTDRLTLETGS
jgi:hypothetical protein